MSKQDCGTADKELVRVMESYRADLIRFACWLTRERSVAEDIVQETLLRAWRARGSLREPSAVRQWLFSIVRREYARLYERKRLTLVDLDESMFREGEALAHDVEDPRLDDLRRAILSLSDEYRGPLAMQVLGGFTTAEIAAELGLTVVAVLTRLFRARNQLREVFGTSATGRPGCTRECRLS
jgi:RNA polymerase sigma-70 factor (ECF subfamily)